MLVISECGCLTSETEFYREAVICRLHEGIPVDADFVIWLSEDAKGEYQRGIGVSYDQSSDVIGAGTGVPGA
jgi:hypothetical protein